MSTVHTDRVRLSTVRPVPFTEWYNQINGSLPDQTQTHLHPFASAILFRFHRWNGAFGHGVHTVVIIHCCGHVTADYCGYRIRCPKSAQKALIIDLFLVRLIRFTCADEMQNLACNRCWTTRPRTWHVRVDMKRKKRNNHQQHMPQHNVMLC